MIKNRIKKIINNKKGFTIVESLFAIFILVISVTGPMSFTQSGLRASFIARDQITAFYLAQDAIEYIKNVRDSNSISNIGGTSAGWLDGLDACYDTGGCTVDSVGGTVTRCGTSNPHPGCFDSSTYHPLKINSSGFFIGSTNDAVSDSIFVREVTITPVPDTADIGSVNEVEIDVVVKWETPQTIGEKSINVKENMFNWAIGI